MQVFEKRYTAEEEGSAVYASYKCVPVTKLWNSFDRHQRSCHLSMYRQSGLGLPLDQTCLSLIYRYLRSRIKALAPGGTVRLAKPFTPDMVQQASGDGLVRRVGPFEMRPGAGAGQRRHPCALGPSLTCYSEAHNRAVPGL